jgi:hypothetical protein
MGNILNKFNNINKKKLDEEFEKNNKQIKKFEIINEEFEKNNKQITKFEKNNKQINEFEIINEEFEKNIQFKMDGTIINCVYKNEKLEGKYIEYIPVSKKNYLTIYLVNLECSYKNGLLDGEYKEYMTYIDGQHLLKKHCNYIDGKLVGEYKEFDLDLLIKHYFYNNGEIDNILLQI